MPKNHSTGPSTSSGSKQQRHRRDSDHKDDRKPKTPNKLQKHRKPSDDSAQGQPSSKASRSAKSHTFPLTRHDEEGGSSTFLPSSLHSASTTSLTSTHVYAQPPVISEQERHRYHKIEQFFSAIPPESFRKMDGTYLTSDDKAEEYGYYEALSPSKRMEFDAWRTEIVSIGTARGETYAYEVLSFTAFDDHDTNVVDPREANIHHAMNNAIGGDQQGMDYLLDPDDTFTLDDYDLYYGVGSAGSQQIEE